MPLFTEDFIRCAECDGYEFLEQTLYTILAQARNARGDNENIPLPSNVLEKRVVYTCSKCGIELDV